MATLFNEENFLKKLENLLPTQDSIQSLGLWIIHHKAHYEAITRTWFNKIKDGDDDLFLKITSFKTNKILYSNKFKTFIKFILSR